MSYELFNLDLEEEIHQGDLVQFQVAVVETNPADPTGPKIPVDIVSGTAVLKFERPDGTGFSEGMAILGASTLGVFGFTATAGTLDQAGERARPWKAQAAVDLSAGPSAWVGHAQQFTFAVYPNLSGA